MQNENPFNEMPLGYLNALLATVTADESTAKLAKEYLKEIDPDIWSD